MYRNSAAKWKVWVTSKEENMLCDIPDYISEVIADEEPVDFGTVLCELELIGKHH